MFRDWQAVEGGLRSPSEDSQLLHGLQIINLPWRYQGFGDPEKSPEEDRENHGDVGGDRGSPLQGQPGDGGNGELVAQELDILLFSL